MKLLRFLPRFRKAYQAMDALTAREGWSRAEIEAFQLQRINAIWRHAAEHTPHYRSLCADLRLPPQFATLEEFRERVPVLPKAVVREGRTLLSRRARPGRWRLTSGSTGTPTAVYWDRDSHLRMLQAKYRFYASWDLDIFDRMAFLWGSGSSLVPGWGGLWVRVRERCEDWLRERLRLPAYRVGRQELTDYLRRISRFQPAVVYGYASSVYLLAGEAEREDFRCQSLRLVCLTSEPVYPSIRAAVERAFRVPVAAEYGSVECGFLAGEGPDRRLRVREDLAMLETLPGEDGQYEIIVTVLTNPSFPLLRYRIGDVTEAPLEVPLRGFAVLAGVSGRDNDFLRSRSGRLLHPVLLMDILEGCDAVRRYRVHQDAAGSVQLVLELREGARPLDTAGLQQKIQMFLEGYPVAVKVADRLPEIGAGKHRWVVSDMAQSGSSLGPLDVTTGQSLGTDQRRSLG